MLRPRRTSVRSARRQERQNWRAVGQETRLWTEICERRALVSAFREASRPSRAGRKANGLAARAFNALRREAGLVAGRGGHVFHGTRRGAISIHADLGLDEQFSMAITGHRDAGVHRRYRQLRKQQILAAQKVLNERLGRTGASK